MVSNVEPLQKDVLGFQARKTGIVTPDRWKYIYYSPEGKKIVIAEPAVRIYGIRGNVRISRSIISGYIFADCFCEITRYTPKTVTPMATSAGRLRVSSNSHQA